MTMTTTMTRKELRRAFRNAGMNEAYDNCKAFKISSRTVVSSGILDSEGCIEGVELIDTYSGNSAKILLNSFDFPLAVRLTYMYESAILKATKGV